LDVLCPSTGVSDGGESSAPVELASPLAHSPVQVAAEAVLQLPAFATHQNYRAFSWSFLLYFESDTRPKFILGPGSLLVLYVV